MEIKSTEIFQTLHYVIYERPKPTKSNITFFLDFLHYAKPQTVICANKFSNWID